MKKQSIITAILLLLLACGGTQQAEKAAQVVATLPPLDQVESTGPSSEAEPPATDETPSEADTPVVVKDVPEDVRTMYLNLMMLELSTVMIEDAAVKVNSGEINGFEAFGAAIAIGAMLDTAKKNFDNGHPVDFLQPAWAEAKIVAPQVQDVLARWVNQELTASDIPAEIEALRGPISGVMTLADEAMANEYGVTSEMLTEMRSEAFQSVRESVSQIKENPE